MGIVFQVPMTIDCVETVVCALIDLDARIFAILVTFADRLTIDALENVIATAQTKKRYGTEHSHLSYRLIDHLLSTSELRGTNLAPTACFYHEVTGKDGQGPAPNIKLAFVSGAAKDGHI